MNSSVTEMEITFAGSPEQSSLSLARVVKLFILDSLFMWEGGPGCTAVCFFVFSTGPAFTVIYVLAGLPLARLADTRSRPFVLIFGVVFWSVMVLLTGFVESFWQLLVLRVFLGIGEVRAVRNLFSQTFPNYSFPKHLQCRAAMTWLNFISYVHVVLCDDMSWHEVYFWNFQSHKWFINLIC